MRDGLSNEEGYSAVGDVIRMLSVEGDVSSWAANHKAKHTSGEHWEYLSASSNVLSGVMKGLFKNTAEYLNYVKQFFIQVGVNSAQFETDKEGTIIASSLLWVTTLDWARLGQLLLNDGIID